MRKIREVINGFTTKSLEFIEENQVVKSFHGETKEKTF